MWDMRAEARRVKGALDELKAVLIGLESGDGELAASSRRGVELLRDVMAAIGVKSVAAGGA